MSYDPGDEAWDEFISKLTEELYPGQYERAVSQFTRERLRSFYLRNPRVLAPIVDMYYESRMLYGMGRVAPTFVFYVATLELMLKAVVLKPVVYGLVHNDALAGLVAEHALGQTGFERYRGLLSRIVLDVAQVDVAAVKRPGASISLLEEAADLQRQRNRVLHQGAGCTRDQMEQARAVVSTGFDEIVHPVLLSLGFRLKPGSGGELDGA